METVNKRKLEITAMPRKELNGHAFLLEQEQGEYESELQSLREANKLLTEERNTLLQNGNMAFQTAAEKIAQLEDRAIQAEKERDIAVKALERIWNADDYWITDEDLLAKTALEEIKKLKP